MEWYIKVLKNYVGFKGRARRKEFWMFVLINMIVSILLGVLGRMISSLGFVGQIYSLAVLLPSVAVGIRRMHDTNHSGWFMLIPIYNLILAAAEGQPGDNRFGPSPKTGISVAS